MKQSIQLCYTNVTFVKLHVCNIGICKERTNHHQPPERTKYPCLTSRYICVTIQVMVYMRKILKSLMDSKGHTGHSLYELSGVPAPTTYRFLNGYIGEPRQETILRWARVYGVSEAQMRGIEPIKDLMVDRPSQPMLGAESVLTRDELALIEGLRSLDKETRRAWVKIGKALSGKCEQKSEKNNVRGISGSNGVRYKDTQQTGGRSAEAKKA